MYGDYIDAIVRAYHHIATTNPRFGELKRAALKNHCKAMCMERFNARDEIVLRNFFGAAEGQKGYLRAIGNCSADRFRPLVDILKKETGNPQREFVELLAWMFDIQPRPYNDRVDYTKVAIDPPQKNPDPGPSEPIISSTTGQSTNRDDRNIKGSTGTQSLPPEEPERKKKIIATVLLLFISSLVGFTLLTNRKMGTQMPKNGECMYWAGDHYVRSPCIQRGGDTVVIPIDPVRLQNFKRITDTSTITINSIGKVWYRIINGNYEFYTTQGYHPVDMQVNLRRLTQKSYEKYLRTLIP